MRIDYDKPVWVYQNLNLDLGSKRRIYSVMQGGHVLAYRYRILLTDVRFVVRPAGRARVLREKRKNVHAFAVGHIAVRGAMGIDLRSSSGLPLKIKYNPYTYPFFYTEAGYIHVQIRGARAALLNENGISAAYTY